MPDLLVKLYALPDVAAALRRAASAGVVVRRANAWERRAVVAFVERHFAAWAAECEVAFGSVPPRCFVAVRDRELAGFACHDVSRRNFFGPAGVPEAERGAGIGTALTLAALAAMREAGYAYAIVGGAGPEAFYARACAATAIPGSTPGIYEPPILRA